MILVNQLNLMLSVGTPGVFIGDFIAPMIYGRKQLYRVPTDKYAELSGINKQTILQIENRKIFNPKFNHIAKMVNALGFTLVVDVSLNTLRRYNSVTDMYDAPLSLYGDNDNPMTQLTDLFKKIVDHEKYGMTWRHFAAETGVPYRRMLRIAKACPNTRMDDVLSILAELDYTISIESKSYHKEWERIGKGPMPFSDSETGELPLADPDLYMLKDQRLHDPRIKKPDGTHYVFPLPEKRHVKTLEEWLT